MESEQSSKVGPTRFLVTLTSFACRKCAARFIPGGVLEQLDLEVACWLATAGAPDGPSLRFLRKVLGLRIPSLATLLRVPPGTVSRWERGLRAIDDNAWITVGSLVLERASRPARTLERLENLGRLVTPAMVRLAIPTSARFRLAKRVVERGRTDRASNAPRRSRKRLVEGSSQRRTNA